VPAKTSPAESTSPKRTKNVSLACLALYFASRLELTRVPQNRWRNYPSGWKDQNGNSHYGADGRHHYKPDNGQSDSHGQNR
jgi:hypothetical protein